MTSLNQCNFIGRVGKDPDTRYLSSGEAVTNISLAVDSSYINKAGEKVDKCEWINVVFYRKLAEIAGEYLKKGSLVYVSGRMETRKYTDKQGIEKYVTDIIATNMKMLGSKDREAHTGKQSANHGTGFNDVDDDLPF